MTKVADIFALLGIKSDKASFAKGRDELGRFTKGAQRGIDKVQAGVGGLIKRFAGFATGAGLALSAASTFNFREGLSDLQTSSEGALGALKDVEAKILSVSDDTGVANSKILEGAAAYVEFTGRGKEASEVMETFGRVNVATGAAMDDTARTAGAMRENLNILPAQFERAFSILIAGGKQGAVELKDIAGILPSLAPAFARFSGGSGLQGLASLNAALQLTRKGFGSAKEAATGLQSLIGLIGQRSKQLIKAGVKIYDTDPKTGIRRFANLQGIVAQIAKVTQGDVGKVGELLGPRKEARAAFEQLAKIKGGWEDLTASTIHATDLQRDYNEKQKRATVKIKRFWNRIKNVMTRVFSVIIDMGGKAIDHLNALALAVGALAVAFVILQRKAVLSALATLGAWAAALVPVILLGAALIALAALYEKATGRDAWEDLKGVLSFILKKAIALKDAIAHIVKGAGMDDEADVPIDVARAREGNLRRRVTGGRVNADGSTSSAALRAAREVAKRFVAEQKFAESDTTLSGLGGHGTTQTFKLLGTRADRDNAILARAAELRGGNISVVVEGDADSEKIKRGIREGKDAKSREVSQ